MPNSTSMRSQANTNTTGSIRQTAAKVNNWTENRTESQFAYFMLFPVLLVFGVLALWPVLYTLETSLYADSFSQFRGEFIGLSNYTELVTGGRDSVLIRPFLDLSNPFQSILPVTLMFTAVTVVFATILGFVQALVLNGTYRGRSIVRVAVLLPWAVPIVVQGMIFYLLFIPAGAGTDLVSSLGLMGPQPLNESVTAFAIVSLADIWVSAPFIALIILAGLQGIDQNLYQVGKVAGASRWEQFRMITLPQVMPVLMIAMLLKSLMSMRVYGLIDATTNCSTVPSLTCGVVGTFNGSLYGTSAALAFITAILIGLVSVGYLVKYGNSSTGGI